MSNIFYRFLVGTLATLLIGSSYAGDQYFSKSQITRKMFNDATEAANRITPTMTDSETELTRVTGDYAQGLTIYHIKMVRFKLSDFLPNELQEFRVNFAAMMIRRNCSTSEIRWKFDQGFSNQYIVRGNDDRIITSVLTSKTSCESRR